MHIEFIILNFLIVPFLFSSFITPSHPILNHFNFPFNRPRIRLTRSSVIISTVNAISPALSFVFLRVLAHLYENYTAFIAET